MRHSLPFAALTMSSDGTTHKNVQFSSRHTTTIPADLASHPKDSFMGVHPELNHTTATQLEGWKDLLTHFCVEYNRHPDTKCVVDPATIWQKLRGYLGDHAADQKKLSGQLEAYHRECNHEV